MKLLKKIILLLLKIVNTERYELQHSLSKNTKAQVEETLSSLKSIQEKRIQNRTHNYIISGSPKDSHLIFKCHQRHFQNAGKEYNCVQKSRLSLN